jgi:hypothetical protein
VVLEIVLVTGGSIQLTEMAQTLGLRALDNVRAPSPAPGCVAAPIRALCGHCSGRRRRAGRAAPSGRCRARLRLGRCTVFACIGSI